MRLTAWAGSFSRSHVILCAEPPARLATKPCAARPPSIRMPRRRLNRSRACHNSKLWCTGFGRVFGPGSPSSHAFAVASSFPGCGRKAEYHRCGRGSPYQPTGADAQHSPTGKDHRGPAVRASANRRCLDQARRGVGAPRQADGAGIPPRLVRDQRARAGRHRHAAHRRRTDVGVNDLARHRHRLSSAVSESQSPPDGRRHR